MTQKSILLPLNLQLQAAKTCDDFCCTLRAIESQLRADDADGVDPAAYRCQETITALTSKRRLIDANATDQLLLQCIGEFFLNFMPYEDGKIRTKQLSHGQSFCISAEVANLVIQVLVPNATTSEASYGACRTCCRLTSLENGTNEYFSTAPAREALCGVLDRVQDAKTRKWALVALANIISTLPAARPGFLSAEGNLPLRRALANATVGETLDEAASVVFKLSSEEKDAENLKSFLVPELATTVVEKLAIAESHMCIAHLGGLIANLSLYNQLTLPIFLSDSALAIIFGALTKIVDALRRKDPIAFLRDPGNAYAKRLGVTPNAEDLEPANDSEEAIRLISHAMANLQAKATFPVPTSMGTKEVCFALIDALTYVAKSNTIHSVCLAISNLAVVVPSTRELFVSHPDCVKNTLRALKLATTESATMWASNAIRNISVSVEPAKCYGTVEVAREIITAYKMHYSESKKSYGESGEICPLDFVIDNIMISNPEFGSFYACHVPAYSPQEETILKTRSCDEILDLFATRFYLSMDVSRVLRVKRMKMMMLEKIEFAISEIFHDGYDEEEDEDTIMEALGGAAMLGAEEKLGGMKQQKLRKIVKSVDHIRQHWGSAAGDFVLSDSLVLSMLTRSKGATMIDVLLAIGFSGFRIQSVVQWFECSPAIMSVFLEKLAQDSSDRMGARGSFVSLLCRTIIASINVFGSVVMQNDALLTFFAEDAKVVSSFEEAIAKTETYKSAIVEAVQAICACDERVKSRFKESKVFRDLIF